MKRRLPALILIALVAFSCCQKQPYPLISGHRGAIRLGVDIIASDKPELLVKK